MTKPAKKTYQSEFGNESAETRGKELEKTYAAFLGGRRVGGYYDGGIDLVFDEGPVPILQVKSSYDFVRMSLGKSFEKGKFIPVVCGDPGKATREEIIKSIIEYGGWFGLDIPKIAEKLDIVKKTRYMIEHSNEPGIARKIESAKRYITSD